MGVANELGKPESDEEFEAMCHALYRRMWNDTSCTRVGGKGQTQFGVDILGHDGKTSVGVQCKHYPKKPFTLSTVTDDIRRADEAQLQIGHLLFATSAANKSALVVEVRKLSEQRRQEGKFTVSVDFWDEISGHLRIYPEVGRAFIPSFPGAPLLEIRDSTAAHLRLYEESRRADQQFQTASLEGQASLGDKLNAIADAVNTALSRDNVPVARGDEADPRVVSSLDFIRDKIREGRCREAGELLAALGEPELFKDQFSKFRWYTNHAAVALLEGRFEDAATEFLHAHQFAPEHEKALVNRAHAYVIRKDIDNAVAACTEGLAKFPKSASLWAINLTVKVLQGDDHPEADLPDDLRDVEDLLFAVANAVDRRGDSASAVELFRRCLEKDSRSFEAKRAYLASALGWAQKDPVLAHFGQLTNEQRAALSDAVNRFEPVEQALPAIQSDHISLEVTNNVCVGLLLLGDAARAHSLALVSLQRHPLSEGLLRLRLHDLEQRNDVAGIRALTGGQLDKLPAAIVGVLAEISANLGLLDWHNDIMAAARLAPGIGSGKLRELHSLTIHAKWMAGARTEALAAAKDYANENPDLTLPFVILGNMLARLEQPDEALSYAMAYASRLPADARALEILQLAELFFLLTRYREAGEEYAKLVKVPGNDEFTRRWLVCLVESDQRLRAREVLDRLPVEVRNLPAFTRIEANLARRTGDWNLMRRLLSDELKRSPNDSSVAVGYVGALHRLGMKSELSAYLESDPTLRGAVEDEFEFAKYQALQGFGDLAIRRLYRLYRSRPGSRQVASYYLGQVLIGPKLDVLDPPPDVQQGCVVHLRTATTNRVIAIDIERFVDEDGWPELISPASNVARLLLGHKVGDRVHLDGFLGSAEAEIVLLESVYSFAATKAHELVDAAAVPEGPLWSVKLMKDDGEPDILPLLESAKQRRAQVQRAFENYRQYRVPVAMLARAIGSDSVSLVLEWPFNEATLFVGIGTHEEQHASAQTLQAGGRPFVMDLLTVAELVQRGGFEAAVRLLGRPLLPYTAREQLLNLLQAAEGPRSTASLSEVGGSLHLTETPASYYEHRESILREMLGAIDQRCELVPTLGPRDVTDLHRTLGNALDHATLDALYLAVERDAVLVCEDGSIRLLAPAAGVNATVGVQAILKEACGRGFLSREQYVDIIIAKIREGHDFVSVGAEDLVAVASRTPSRRSPEVSAALETFRRAALHLPTGVHVACDFLLRAASKVETATFADYAKLVLDVLKHGRDYHADAIHRAVARTVHEGIRILGRRVKPRERRLFTPLLRAPGQLMFSSGPTAVALAVRSLFEGSDAGE